MRVMLCAVFLAAVPGCGDDGRPPAPGPLVAPGEGAPHDPDVGEHGVVGFWESIERSRGGLGNTLDLRADGSVSTGICAMVEMRYALEGDRLTLRADGEAAGMLPALRVEFVGDDAEEVVVRPWDPPADGDAAQAPQEQRRRRLTPRVQGVPAIVGDWSGVHQAGGTAYERYTADGRLSLRVPMPAPDHGLRYSVIGDRLHTDGAGAAPSSAVFRLTGDVLEITPEGKRPLTFRRVPGGAWYRPPTAAEVQRILDTTPDEVAPPR
jgi:hypothetical protein